MNLYTISNLIRYLLIEKPRGIDFSISDSTFTSEEAQENYYSRTDTSTLKQIKHHLHLSKSDSLLDIGCGKGYVLYYFSGLGIGKLSGIEKYYDYCSIAQNNLRILEIDDKANIICCDAIHFKHYDEYNIFFMFNPFREETADVILKMILHSVSSNPRNITLISVQDFLNGIIIKNGFVEKEVIVSKLTGVKTYIYSFEKR